MASLFTNGKFQATNASGVVPGGKLYTYAAGTTTPLATYTLQDGVSSNANPVICNASGQASVWLGTSAYRMILKDASDVTIWDVDNIRPLTDATQMTYTADETGAVDRTVASKLADTVSAADFGATGSGDETAEIQAAIDSFSGITGTLDLGGLAVSITTVTIPNAKAITIKNGAVTVTGTGAGFSKTTSTSPQSGGTYAKYDLVFDGVHFTRAVTDGSCIYINLAWQDATGGVIVMPNCSFNLTNGAVGVRAARSFFNRIGGRFMMDSGSTGTSTGFLCDATEEVLADAYPSGPLVTTFDNVSFTGGIGFDCDYVEASVWNAFEGFTFGPTVAFYSSLCLATKYNFLQFNGSHMTSARTVLDSGYNTVITGGYWDRQAGEGPVLTFKRTQRSVQQVSIGGGVQFNAQGTAGDLIYFSDADPAASTQMTNVTIDNVLFVGGINDTGSKIKAIHCDDDTLRNLNITGAQNFQNLWACVSFTQEINRSTIKAFEARDITHYAENVTTGYGISSNYNRFDGVYKVYESVEMVVPIYTATGTAETISTLFLPHESMMRAPITTVSAQTDPFGAGYFDILVPAVYRNGIQVNLRKNITAPGATRGGQTATITLNASAYLAPT
jgi:hypothetical protein